MSTALSLRIAMRYTRAKRRNHFISFISLTSMLGIALGVLVLITVLSVMNGFNQEIRERILNVTPHMTIMHHADDMALNLIQSRLAHVSEVTGMSPYIDGQGMLMYQGRMQGVFVRGIEPDTIDAVFPLTDTLQAGSLAVLESQPYGVIVGSGIAQKLGLYPGKKVTLVIPEATVSIAGITPRLRQLTVVGIFESGYLFDNSHLFVHRNTADKLYREGGVHGVQCQLQDPFQAPRVALEAESSLPSGFFVTPWTQQHSHYFQAVQMEKTMMFFILLLIVAVAAFNLVSTLVMMVTDKEKEIGILRAMGASRWLIMRVFMLQGMLVGTIGTLLGTVGGIALANNVTGVVRGIESLFGHKLLSADIYFVDFLPSDFHWSDAGIVCCSTLLLSFIATLYPAWRASRIEIVEAIRYG